jgi:hypothetical protein
MRKSLLHVRAAKSVLELLVWLLLAGIIGATIWPNLRSMLQGSLSQKDIHNAQTLVRIFEKARQTGLSLEGGSKQETIDRVVSGAWATTGPLAGTFFGLPEMTEMEKLGATGYLEFENGTLKLRESGPE